jgi:hypothetical protein
MSVGRMIERARWVGTGGRGERDPRKRTLRMVTLKGGEMTARVDVPRSYTQGQQKGS